MMRMKRMNMKHYVSPRVLNLQPSGTIVMAAKARKLLQEGHDIVNLAGGDPNFNTPQRIIDDAVRSLSNGNTHYVDSRGIADLRKKIAEKLYTENKIEVDHDAGIIVTAGAKYALFLAFFTFLDFGDEVLVLDPSYVSYKPLIEMSGGIPVPVTLDYKFNYEITEEKLSKHITAKTKLILINSPNNPTGRVMSQNEINALINCMLKHDMLMISDEIYEKIIFDGNKHISPGSFDVIKDRVVTINGYSKSCAMAGWRLGYLASHPTLIKEVLKVQQHTVACAGSFIQQAAVHAFECEREVHEMIEQYRKRREVFVKALNEVPGVECKSPEGAFYVFPRIEYQEMNSTELCNHILENAKVSTTPGDAFGTGGDKCIRMSFANSMEDLEKAVERISKILK
jgi:aspartate/methionine/tyrosine aminotransferase